MVIGFSILRKYTFRLSQAYRTFQAISFLNLEKYRPETPFFFMTLGPLLLSLGLRGSCGIRINTLTSATSQVGRAPLFFYVLHLYLLRIPGSITAAFVWGPDRLGLPPLNSTSEWSLLTTRIIWIFANVVLAPITGWYAKTCKRLGRLGSCLLLNSSSENGRYNMTGKFFVLFYKLLSKLVF